MSRHQIIDLLISGSLIVYFFVDCIRNYNKSETIKYQELTIDLLKQRLSKCEEILKIAHSEMTPEQIEKVGLILFEKAVSATAFDIDVLEDALKNFGADIYKKQIG